MSKSIKFIAFGCRHAPLSDPSATQWVIDAIAREKPDAIIDLGDGIEGNAASQWQDAKEIILSLADEFAADAKFMFDVRKAAKAGTRLIRLAGNHEANLLRKGRIDPRTRDLCKWYEGKEFEHWTTVKDYIYCRRRGSFWLTPQTCFSHGYETSAARIAREAMYFTSNAPLSVYVAAHTHRPHSVQPVMWGDLPMGRWHCNVGCLRDLKPDYMHRKATWNWGHAMAIGEAMPLKSPRMTKEWDMRIEVKGMYDELAA